MTCMNVRFTKKFYKQYHKAPIHIMKAFDKKLALFLSDPFNPRLNNHLLSGNRKGLWSINITGDWRALYVKNGDTIIFELLGTHSQLYQ